MPSDWNECIVEADDLYVYLCSYLEDMLEGDRIRHFDIHYANSLMMGYYEGVASQYGEEIHQALIPWIRKEAESGRLFQKFNWKPFRVPYEYTLCYTGYRMLFPYDTYLFVLTMRNDKDWNEQGVFEQWKFFGVALYGWVEEESSILQPDKDVYLPEDGRMPNRDWNSQ